MVVAIDCSSLAATSVSLAVEGLVVLACGATGSLLLSYVLVEVIGSVASEAASVVSVVAGRLVVVGRFLSLRRLFGLAGRFVVVVAEDELGVAVTDCSMLRADSPVLVSSVRLKFILPESVQTVGG